MPAGFSGRPRFLASVMSAPEALTALAAGAEIIDGKNPAEGALGALPHATVRAIVEAVGHTVPVSATIGDLPANPDVLCDAAIAMAATGIDLVKIGFFDGGDAKASIAALGRLDLGQARLVGLLLADRNPDLNLVAAMADAGFAGVMLDTATKDGRALPDVMSHRRNLPLCRCRPRGRPLRRPRWRAPSGAHPHHRRVDPGRHGLPRRVVFWQAQGRIDRRGGRARRRTRTVRNLHTGPPSVGNTLTWPDGPSRQSRGHTMTDRRKGAATMHSAPAPLAHTDDKIFVKDYIKDANIGIYAEEKGVTQQIRLTVDAFLAPGIVSTVDEMVEVPSYTDIIDAIDHLIGRGHINLVETLAEELATMLLRDNRIGGVRVLVEKLERGPVRGVEIYRTRSA